MENISQDVMTVIGLIGVALAVLLFMKKYQSGKKRRSTQRPKLHSDVGPKHESDVDGSQ